MNTYHTVKDFLDDLSVEKRDQVEILRSIILETVSVEEHIKWNSPSYVYEGEDRITFNLHGNDVKILIHCGATRKEDKAGVPVLADDRGIVHWSSDIRGMITFIDKHDIEEKREAFIAVLTSWLKIK